MAPVQVWRGGAWTETTSKKLHLDAWLTPRHMKQLPLFRHVNLWFAETTGT